MRILLSTIGSRGDVQPLVALAFELRTLGADVRMCVPPDFREWIAGLGFHVTPIGPELRKMTAAAPSSSPPLSPERRRQLAEASVAAQFETVAKAAESCDAILGATALQIAARSVAEKMRVPYVFVAYTPVVLPSLHHPPPPLPPIPGQPLPPASAGNRDLWQRDAQRFHDLFGGALNAHRERIGLPVVGDTRSHVFTDHPWLAADAVLGPWPDPSDDAVVQTGAWILSDQRPLPREVDAFLESGEPPVYFGFGSVRAPQDLGGVMIDAARAIGRRAIVSRGWAGWSLDEHPDCLTVDEVNLQVLFKRVAAVVHHGGAGTTTTAALAGAPQVVVPQVYDQHYWAERVDRLGVGVAHVPGLPTASSLREALERTLRAEVSARAAAIASSIRLDGARVAAERLLTLSAGR